jgi:cytochrome c
MTTMRWTLAAGLCALLVLTACGNENGVDAEGGAPAPAGELSQAELERGIGPVIRVEMAPLDAALAAEGREIFEMKCASCHRFEARFVGPPLGDVMERRTPEFVMNMMLNPAEMVQKHPIVRQMLAEYYTPMPFQNLTEQDARAVLEYLRTIDAANDES